MKKFDVFFLKSSGVYIPISIRRINWIKAKGNNCTIHLDNNETHAIRSSLANMMVSLSESPVIFARCHRNYLINCNKIEFYNPTGIVRIAGEDISVSKIYKKALESKLSFF